MRKMQKMEEKKCTAEIKLSKLNDQIKDQYEEKRYPTKVKLLKHYETKSRITKLK